MPPGQNLWETECPNRPVAPITAIFHSSQDNSFYKKVSIRDAAKEKNCTVSVLAPLDWKDIVDSLMDLSQLANDRILDQPVYEPGKPIEEVAKEFGLPLEQICKLASNENP